MCPSASHIHFIRIKPELLYQLAFGKPNQALNVHFSVTALSQELQLSLLGSYFLSHWSRMQQCVPSPSSCLSYQFEALCVKAVPLPAGHGLQQSLLLLGAARRLQLVHSGQVEEDALVEVECRVLLHQAFQLAQGLLQTAQIQQAHRCIVVGLGTYSRRE